MKKRFFSSIVILLVILIPFTQAQLLEKQTTELLDIQLTNINLIDNKLKFTVLNNNNIDIKLRFKLDNNLVYNDLILKSYTSQLYNINYNKQSKLEITPYTIKDNNIILYSLSTITYNLNNIKSSTGTSASTATTQVTTSDIITSNAKTSYIYSNGHRTASISNKGINYYHDDILSSTRLITDNNNLVIASYDYYPFGSELRSSGSITNNKLYTSKELDNNNLYYYNARYYNSNNGRFISIDPIFDPSEAGYVYVGNNPITSNDPSGNIGAPVYEGGFSDLNRFYGMPSEDVTSTFGYKLAGYFVGSREERPPMFGGTFKVQDIMFGPSCGIGCGSLGSGISLIRASESKGTFRGLGAAVKSIFDKNAWTAHRQALDREVQIVGEDLGITPEMIESLNRMSVHDGQKNGLIFRFARAIFIFGKVTKNEPLQNRVIPILRNFGGDAPYDFLRNPSAFTKEQLEVAYLRTLLDAGGTSIRITAHPDITTTIGLGDAARAQGFMTWNIYNRAWNAGIPDKIGRQRAEDIFNAAGDRIRYLSWKQWKGWEKEYANRPR